MIRLHYSNHTERLVRALIRDVGERRGRSLSAALEAAHIIVPHQALATYIRLSFAREAGIAANLTIGFLRTYLEALVGEASDELRVASPPILQSGLLSILLDDKALMDPKLEPVRRYLDGADGDPQAADLRRFQLSRELARLFDEYILSRAELLEHWTQRPDAPARGEVEGWQRALWLRLVGPDGLLQEESSGVRYVPLPEAFERLPLGALSLPDASYLLCVSVAAPTLQRILAQIAQSTELHVYALNPCREFWEDTEAKTGGQRELFDLDLPSDTPALRFWGRAGRENVRLLNELAGWTFAEHYSEENDAPPTVLRQLQRDILRRAPERTEIDPDFTFASDESIRILACPGIRREAEAIAAEIWVLMSASDSSDGSARDQLSFDEIGVVLTGRDQEAYRAHLSAAFHEHFDIPHHFLNVPLASTSRVVEAIDLLLALPSSAYTRQDLLRLITHPAALARRQETDIDAWVAWSEALSILHGADHGDHRGTYIERDLYNWEQGVRRLALGAFMTSERSGDDRVYESRGHAYVPHEHAFEHLPSAARFVSAVRSLVADARFAAAQLLSFSEWARFLRLFVATYVGAETESEEQALVRCFSAVQGLERLDVRGERVSFRIAAELVRASLGSLSTNRGRPLTSGVVVGPLELLHAIPQRVVFVTGLGEGRFPCGDRPNQLDLRTRDRKPHDLSPREQDQYRFLELLTSTRDRLCLSYVCRDERTGDRLQPSPVVQELQHVLERGYVGASGLRARTREAPLRRFRRSLDEMPVLASPAARREAQAVALRASMLEHLGGTALAPDMESLRREFPPERWHRLASRLRIIDPPQAPHVDSGSSNPARIPYGLLRRFLEDPLQGWAKLILGLGDEEEYEDPLARDTERFATSNLDATILLRSLLLEHRAFALNDEALTSIEPAYDRRALRWELVGKLPTGVFSVAERRRHLATLAAWSQQLERVTRCRPLPIAPARFSAAQEENTGGAALVLDLSPRSSSSKHESVEIHGETEPLISTPSSSLTLSVRSAMSKAQKRLHELRAFLDHVALTASGLRGEEPHTGHLILGDGSAWEVRFAAIARPEAKAYLGAMVGDLLHQSHAYRLPFETGQALLQMHASGAPERALRRLLDAAKSRGFTPREIEPLGVDEALERAERRLGLYMRSRLSPEA